MGLITGRLDRRIRIERSTPVDDGYQTRPGNWATLTTVWAQYKPAKPSERFELAARQAVAPVAFLIRWSSKVADVGAGDRVRFPATDDGQWYDIVGDTQIGRRDGIELQCVAVSDGG